MLSKWFTNTIRLSLDAYWQYALTEDYNHCLYVDVLKYREYKLVHAEAMGDRVCRRIQYAPPPPAGPLRSLAGRFRASLLTEALIFDRNTGCAVIDYIPSSFAERTRIRAMVSCVRVDAGSFERVAACDMALDLPLIGGLAERTLARFLEDQYALHARFAEEYVARVTTTP